MAHYTTSGEKLVAHIKRFAKLTSHTILVDFQKQSLKTFLLNQLTNNVGIEATDRPQNTFTGLDHKNENFELLLKKLESLEGIMNVIEMFCLLNGFEHFSQSSSYCKAEKKGETMFVTITQSS